jgi:hypothetical protein
MIERHAEQIAHVHVIEIDSSDAKCHTFGSGRSYKSIPSPLRSVRYFCPTRRHSASNSSGDAEFKHVEVMRNYDSGADFMG